MKLLHTVTAIFLLFAHIETTLTQRVDNCENLDLCDFKDSDKDGYPDTLVFCEFLEDFCVDNCPLLANKLQFDCNKNGIGDACDTTCLPETDQVFFYNWTCTVGGRTVYQTCIQGGANASRFCNENGEWSNFINTSLCLSPEYAAIKENISIDSLRVVAKIINQTVPATAGDVGVIVNVLNTTIEATSTGNNEGREMIVNDTVIVVDVLADDSSQILLTQSQDDTQVSQRVLTIMEQQASSLALNSEKAIKLDSAKNVFIETQTVDVTQSDGIFINASNIQGEIVTPTVAIPIPQGIDPSRNLSISVVVLKNIAKLINNFADEITVGVEGLKLNSFTKFEIVSSILAIQLYSGNELLTTDGTNTLAEISLPLSLSRFDLDRNYIKPTCLYLVNSTGSDPQWLDTGIVNVSTDDIKNGVINCLPGHNTAFVVLVGVGGLESQSVVLNILSYIGCSLSVICLLISMTIYILFGRKLLRKIYHFVHFQLALSLCLLYLAFLFGVEPAYANVWLYIPCKFVTIVVEYLLLVTFLWMIMEGIVILIMIIWPFHQFNWIHFVIFSCISWCVPLIYVVPFIPFFHKNYISPPIENTTMLTNQARYCFVHNDEGTNLIYSVTVPLAMIIILNFIILAIVIIRCFLVIYQQKSLSKLERTQKTGLKLLRLVLVMFPVLGFGWSFGLLAIYFNTVVFAWLFTILCAFQGIIYLFFVLLIRRDIQRSIVSALNLKAKFLTLQSRISSYNSKPVSKKETTSISQNPSTLEQAKNSLEQAMIGSPTVELENRSMSYEEKNLPLEELDVKMQVTKFAGILSENI